MTDTGVHTRLAWVGLTAAVYLRHEMSLLHVDL